MILHERHSLHVLAIPIGRRLYLLSQACASSHQRYRTEPHAYRVIVLERGATVFATQYSRDERTLADSQVKRATGVWVTRRDRRLQHRAVAFGPCRLQRDRQRRRPGVDLAYGAWQVVGPRANLCSIGKELR